MQYAEAQPEGHLPGTEKKKSVHIHTGQQFCYICQIVKKKHPGQRIHRKFIVIFTAVEKKGFRRPDRKTFPENSSVDSNCQSEASASVYGKRKTEGTYHRDRKNRIFSKRIRDMKMPKIPMETRKSLSKSEMLIWAPMITAKH